MATPITHIVLADKLFNSKFNDKKREDFFVGTSFPDIRYLNVIERDITHYHGLALGDLKQDNSFISGLKFHSILDEIRENYMVRNKIYLLCPKSKYTTQSLKLLEDEILYDKIKDWSIFIKYFEVIHQEERLYNIEDNKIIKRHEILQRYFKIKPNKNTVEEFITSIGFTKEISDEINKNITIMRKNKNIISIIETLYDDFDLIIQ